MSQDVPTRRRAQEVFENYLCSIEDGEGLDVERLVEVHAELEGELRKLSAEYQRTESILRHLTEGLPSSAAGTAEDEALDARLTEIRALQGAGPGYEVIEEIARGGMGEVFAVRDKKLRRTVAMKVLTEGESEDDWETRTRLRRFLSEAELTGRLGHPAVVTVHDIGIDAEGRPFFTMPLLRGRRFQDVVEEIHGGADHWTESRAVGVLVQICQAMAYAHARGVVHRDLKPSNIMVGRFGETFVLDWGLAKVIGEPEPDRRDGPEHPPPDSSEPRIPNRNPLSEESSGSVDATLPGDVVGTPSYMPPEQAEGQLERIGPLADVYAVGAILYHLLTGRRPYGRASGERSGTPAIVLQSLLRGPPTPIETLRRDVAPELVAICEKAMSRDPAQRYPTMGKFARDLQAYLDQRVVSAHERGALPELKKWVRRNRAFALTTFALSAAFVLGLAGYGWKEVEHRKELQASEALATGARDLAESRLADLRRVNYFNDVTIAQSRLEDGLPAGTLARLDACDEDLRGWEWSYLRRIADESIARAPLEGAPQAQALALFPDGSALAHSTGGGTVEIIELPSLESRRSLQGEHETEVLALAISSDSALIASGDHSGAIVLWDAASGRPLRTLAGHGPELVRSLSFAPDGARLASGGDDLTIRVWDVASGAEVHSTPLEARGYSATVATYAPDGRLAVGTGPGVSIRDPDTLVELRSVTTGDDFWLRALAFSADGRFLAFGGVEAAAVPVWDLERDEVFRVNRNPSSTVSFLGNTHRLAVTDLSTLCIWDLDERALTRRLTGHESNVLSVAGHPDGRRLASVSANRMMLFDCEAPRLPNRAPGHIGMVVGIAFAPTGDRIVSAAYDKTLRVWDASDLSTLYELQPDQGWTVNFAISPDGQYLWTGGDSGSLVLFELESGRELERMKPRAANVSSMAFAPDGRAFAAVDYEGRLATYSHPEGIELAAVDLGEKLREVDYAPGGEALAVAGDTGTVWILDRDLHARQRFVAQPERALSLAFSPDGARLYTTGWQGYLRTFDVTSGELIWSIRATTSAVYHVAVSPDGSRLFTPGRDGWLQVWSATDGRHVIGLANAGTPITAVSLQAGSLTAAAGDDQGNLLLWRLESD